MPTGVWEIMGKKGGWAGARWLPKPRFPFGTNVGFGFEVVLGQSPARHTPPSFGMLTHRPVAQNWATDELKSFRQAMCRLQVSTNG